MGIRVGDLRKAIAGRTNDEILDVWIVPRSGGGVGAKAYCGPELGGSGIALQVPVPEGYDLTVEPLLPTGSVGGA